MTDRPGWSVAELARRSGLSRAAIFDWLKGGRGKSITIASVNAVADALGDDRRNALLAAAGLTETPERDPEVDLILASDWSEERKVEMIERLMRRREEQRRERLADLRFLLGEQDEATG